MVGMEHLTQGKPIFYCGGTISKGHTDWDVTYHVWGFKRYRFVIKVNPPDPVEIVIQPYGNMIELEIARCYEDEMDCRAECERRNEKGETPS